MKISGTADLAAPPERVFEALNDPRVLAAAIPGVQSLEALADDRYRMTITAGVASVKGAYTGEVSLTDLQPPTSFTLHGKGAGAPGNVDATVRVTLTEAGGGTAVSYEADAVVGGMVGGVGQRMLTSVARTMAGQFFGAVDRVMAEGVPSVPVPRPAAEASPTVPEAAAAAASAPAPGPAEVAVARPYVDEDRVPFWVVLAGVGAGAFWALAGVVVGYRIAKGSRR